MYSNAKRPLSHSQPWLTGWESTPSERTSRSAEDCNATRQPTEHNWHDDSTDDRSHGRARNRYGDASSAPTGQICTVFPEKYDVNGWLGNVSTCISAPRSTNWISGAPPTSSADRVPPGQTVLRSLPRT